MASIDERVVAMSFENGKFEAGVAQTMATLSKLEASLANVGRTNGLQALEQQSSRITFGGLSSAIDSVGSHFSALSVAAGVALGGIVQKAAAAGANFVKSFTLGPVLDGLSEFGTNMSSIQTILANTQSKGTSLDQVNVALQDLNTYSDKTIYNFSQMAKNIGTFTAAGVDLDTATQSIKGIANLAALSGSNAEQASSAMYQLSQAIAAGTVNLQDWRSVENAGIGGEIFQKALFNMAKAMGTLTNVPVGQTFEEWKKAGNSFRQSLSATASASQDHAKVMKKAHVDAAKTIQEAEKSAADATEAAAQRVKDAHEGAADAAKQGAADVADAVKAQADTVKQSAEDVKGALDGVKEARKRLAEAMKPPSEDELQAAADNLKTAQLDQADLAGAVTDAQREQTRASEDLATAQAKLVAVQKDPKATASDLQAAQRAVEDATRRVADAADAQTRAQLQQSAATRGVNEAEKELQTTRDKGTKKDAAVKDARDALTVAITKYKDAQKKAQEDIQKASQHTADVQLKASENIRKAQQRLADAEKQQADTIKDSQSRIADAHKRAAEQINAARDSINKKPPKSWLTSDVLTSTLKTFTGDMTDAQLKAQGFTDAQIKSIQQTAKTAQKSAQEVKTLGQVFAIARETMGSGWAQTFRIIFGNFDEAKGLFTGLSNSINGFINTNAKARNKVLADWEALGGRKVLIEGLKDAFKDLQAIVKPLSDAFREVFPAQTGKSLFELTKKFRDLMESLKIGPETADKLKRTFAGFFAILHIGFTIVKDVAKVIFDLLGIAGKGSGSFLGVTASIGDFLVKLDKAISKGHALEGFFKGLEAVLALPISALKHLGDLIASLFGADTAPKTKGVSDAMGGLNDALQPLKGTLDAISNAWEKVVGFFDRIVIAVPGVLKGIGDAVSNFISTVAQGISNTNFDTVFAALETTLIGGIFLAIKKGLGKGVSVDFGGGVLKNLSKTFEALTGNLKAMQETVKATTLLEIATAIGVLAAGVAVLASINSKDLNKAMTAVAVGLGELVGAMAILGKVGGGAAFIQLPILATGLIAVATAVTILAGAMKIFATMKWEDLAKGLTGVGGGLTAIGIGLTFIGPETLAIGPGLVAVAIALGIMSGAMKVFATMKWEEIGKGLVGIAGGLTAIGIGLVGIGPEVLLIGPGLVILSIGLSGLAGAVALFGHMDLETIGVGVLGIAGALVAIGLAMSAMPATLPITAAGLVLLAPALAAIAGTIILMGNMKIATLAKGIIALGGALGVLAIGLTAMIGGLPGALALDVAAAGLAALVPVLGIMGKMKWSTILGGLAKLAVVMGAISLAGAVAAPGLILLGAALIPLGIGMTTVSAAIYVFAKAVQIMGDNGAKAVSATIVALTALAVAVPKIVIDFLKGLVEIVNGVATLLPKVTVALGLMLDTIIAFVVTHAKPFGEAFIALIQAAAAVIQANAPTMIQTGFILLQSFLAGVAQNIPMVTTQVVAIITGILTTLASAAPDLIAAGVQALVSFLTGITQHLPAIVATVTTLIATFVTAIANNVNKLVTAAGNLMIKFIAAIVGFLPKMLETGTSIVLKFLLGIANALPKIFDGAVAVAKRFLEGLAHGLVKLVNIGFQAMIDFLNGLAKAIRDHSHDLNQAGFNVADAIIDGMLDGIGQLGHKVVDKLGELIHLLPSAAKKILGIHSPSKVFDLIGQQTMQGLAQGIDSGGSLAVKSMGNATDGVTSAAAAGLSQVPTFLSKMTDINPTITPVLDLSRIAEDAPKIGELVQGSTDVIKIGDSTVASRSTNEARGLSFLMGSSDPWGVSAKSVNDWIEKHPIVFNQHNTSPKALTPAEIYRLTHNQLASAKGRLFGKVDNIR